MKHIPDDPKGEVAWLIRHLVQTKGERGWELGLSFEWPLHALSIRLRFPKGILFPSALTQKALRLLAESGGDPTPERFDSVLASAIDETLADIRARTSRFGFLIPIPTKTRWRADRIERVRILGTDFRLLWLQNAKLHDYLPSEHSDWFDVQTWQKGKEFAGLCAYAEASGVDHVAAWSQIDAAFEVLRCGLQLILSWRTRVLIGSLTQMGTVSPPGYMLHFDATGMAYAGKMYCHAWWPRVESRKERDVAQITEKLVEYLAPIQEAPDESHTASLFADVIQLYGQALDREFPHDSLLGLWQVLETIVLRSDDHGDTEKVINRIAAILDPSPELPPFVVKSVLKWFRDHRNAMVHTGAHFRLKQDEICWLKIVAECAVAWLRERTVDIPNRNALEQWWAIRGKPNAECRAIQEAVQYVLNDPNNRS